MELPALKYKSKSQNSCRHIAKYTSFVKEMRLYYPSHHHHHHHYHHHQHHRYHHLHHHHHHHHLPVCPFKGIRVVSTPFSTLFCRQLCPDPPFFHHPEHSPSIAFSGVLSSLFLVPCASLTT